MSEQQRAAWANAGLQHTLQGSRARGSNDNCCSLSLGLLCTASGSGSLYLLQLGSQCEMIQSSHPAGHLVEQIPLDVQLPVPCSCAQQHLQLALHTMVTASMVVLPMGGQHPVLTVWAICDLDADGASQSIKGLVAAVIAGIATGNARNRTQIPGCLRQKLLHPTEVFAAES